MSKRWYHRNRFHVWCENCNYRTRCARLEFAEIKLLDHEMETNHRDIVLYEIRLPRVRPAYLKAYIH